MNQIVVDKVKKRDGRRNERIENLMKNGSDKKRNQRMIYKSINFPSLS